MAQLKVHNSITLAELCYVSGITLYYVRRTALCYIN